MAIATLRYLVNDDCYCIIRVLQSKVASGCGQELGGKGGKCKTELSARIAKAQY